LARLDALEAEIRFLDKMCAENPDDAD
jgi:hypothetical protein